MSLNWLYATRFRNLIDSHLELAPGINLIHGSNGSGKTSLLEAAYFLSTARSFRTAMQDPIIQKGESGCLVRGEINVGGQQWLAGIARERSGVRQIRLNGEDCKRTSELALMLPTLLLGPETVDLLLGPPEGRRKFLNWGLFHVEHGFTALWNEANRCLKQRNQILRDGAQNQDELRTWTIQLAQAAAKLDQGRNRYLESYRPVFTRICKQLCNLDQIKLHYQRGWEDSVELMEIYEKEVDIDQKRGFTQKGFQRADVRITVNGQPAVKVCSRGELKALVWSMVLAQGELTQKKATLYLIDDMASEFDEEHRLKLGSFLRQNRNQVLLTGVELGALEASCEGSQQCVFHVKHGKVES